MYPSERFRVGLTFLVGTIVGIVGFTIVAMSLAASEGRSGWLYYLLYYYVPLFQWALPWLPHGEASAGFALLKVPTLLGFVLMCIGGIFARYAKNYLSIINEAARASRVAGLVGRRTATGHNQLFKNVSAGRDLTILTIEDANHKLDDWNNNVWKGPGGALLLSAGATIIAAAITKLLGLTH